MKAIPEKHYKIYLEGAYIPEGGRQLDWKTKQETLFDLAFIKEDAEEMFKAIKEKKFPFIDLDYVKMQKDMDQSVIFKGEFRLGNNLYLKQEDYFIYPVSKYDNLELASKPLWNITESQEPKNGLVKLVRLDWPYYDWMEFDESYLTGTKKDALELAKKIIESGADDRNFRYTNSAMPTEGQIKTIYVKPEVRQRIKLAKKDGYLGVGIQRSKIGPYRLK